MQKLINKNNILLAKGDVGKPKPTTVKLPDNNHSYGKALNKD